MLQSQHEVQYSAFCISKLKEAEHQVRPRELYGQRFSLTIKAEPFHCILLLKWNMSQ